MLFSRGDSGHSRALSANMAAKISAKDHVVYHKDGSLWARGKKIGEEMVGYWEWFRKDGTKMRSGYFEDGEQVGEWATYDKKGEVYKLTQFKRKVK